MNHIVPISLYLLYSEYLECACTMPNAAVSIVSLLFPFLKTAALAYVHQELHSISLYSPRPFLSFSFQILSPRTTASFGASPL